MYEIFHYQSQAGYDCYQEWLDGLESATKARITIRLSRLEKGNFGDHRSVGEGVFEIRLDFGSGYRVYYALKDKKAVLLLGGGSKGRQDTDIRLAKERWNEFKGRKNERR